MRARTPTSPWNRRNQKQLCVTMPPDLLAAVEASASREKINRSQWVRERLEWALEDEENERAA